MLECVYEFNACVPYAGVSTVGAGEGFELDGQAIAAVLALLPEELQPGLPAPTLAPDDVKQVSSHHGLDTYLYMSAWVTMFGCAYGCPPGCACVASKTTTSHTSPSAHSSKYINDVVRALAMQCRSHLAGHPPPPHTHIHTLFTDPAHPLTRCWPCRLLQCCTACSAWRATPCWPSSC
jgi:hypothetical protein